jgi:hypothetical protein
MNRLFRPDLKVFFVLGYTFGSRLRRISIDYGEFYMVSYI